MFDNHNYSIAALVGFLTGVFVIPTAINLGVKSYVVLVFLPIAVPVLFVAGVLIGGFLSRWLSVMLQFSKFAAVGLSNTAIDFGVLNILSMATGYTSGLIIGGVNVPGVAVAVVNSYLWNQFWVFKGREGSEGLLHDFPRFLAVTVVGLLINSGIVVFATTYVDPFFGLGQVAWLNVAKAAATAVALGWNFVGYKFLVFRAQA